MRNLRLKDFESPVFVHRIWEVVLGFESRYRDLNPKVSGLPTTPKSNMICSGKEYLSPYLQTCFMYK